jgi:hypothetical protein
MNHLYLICTFICHRKKLTKFDIRNIFFVTSNYIRHLKQYCIQATYNSCIVCRMPSILSNLSNALRVPTKAELRAVHFLNADLRITCNTFNLRFSPNFSWFFVELYVKLTLLEEMEIETTREFNIKIQNGANADEVAKSLGFINKGKVFDNWYTFEHKIEVPSFRNFYLTNIELPTYPRCF